MLDFVNEHGPLQEDRARRYFCELISALDYLHNSQLVAHRDLKAENVLLDRNDNIRLIDFGLSKYFTKGTPTLVTACGSPAYCAPDMIRGELYTKAADIWSAGVLLYAMVAGTLPYNADSIPDLLHKIVFDDIEYPQLMSRSLTDLLRRMLTKDPAG
jgi:serine/threonine protein kinase